MTWITHKEITKIAQNAINISNLVEIYHGKKAVSLYNKLFKRLRSYSVDYINKKHLEKKSFELLSHLIREENGE